MKLKDCWVYLPCLPFLVAIINNCPNVPWYDDFEVVLGTLNKWVTSGWGDRMSLLFEQHGEHRLLYSRLLYVGYYSLFGDINFRNLMFVGYFHLLTVGVIGVYFIKQIGVKYWQSLAFIWCLMVFDLNSYEAASWTMASIQNYGTLALFFFSMYFYGRGKAWWLGPILQLICVFSSGNGVIASLLIMIFCLRQPNKKWITALSIFVLVTPLYFINYDFTHPPSNPFDISVVLLYLIRMCGAPFSFDKVLSLAFGVAVLFFLGYLFPYDKIKRLWSIVCVLGFVSITMGTASLFRSCMVGAQFQTSRYLILPQILIAILVVFVSLKTEGKKHHRDFMIISLITLCIVYYHNYEFGKLGFERTASRVLNYKYYYPDQQEAERISNISDSLDIYHINENR